MVDHIRKQASLSRLVASFRIEAKTHRGNIANSLREIVLNNQQRFVSIVIRLDNTNFHAVDELFPGTHTFETIEGGRLPHTPPHPEDLPFGFTNTVRERPEFLVGGIDELATVTTEENKRLTPIAFISVRGGHAVTHTLRGDEWSLFDDGKRCDAVINLAYVYQILYDVSLPPSGASGRTKGHRARGRR